MSSEEFDQSGDEQASEDQGFNATEPSEGEFVIPQEKKPLSKGTVVMFVLMAAAGAGVWMMYLRGGPKSASAAVTDPKAQQVIKQFMTDKDKNLGLMQQMLRDTENVVKQFLNYPSVTQVPLSDLKTNPFRLTAVTPDGEQPSRNDEREKKRREEERLAVLKAVQGLQLQSVIVSGNRKNCMINNTLFSEGEQVNEFIVERISPNSVIVKSGAYRFELRMQR